MESELQFDFSYGEGTSWEQIVAFETAGMMWADYISDDITVNIHVEMTNSLPDNVIGGALPGMLADVNYTNFRNAYQADITSWKDQKSFDSLSLIQEGSGGLGPGGTWEKFEGIIDLGASVVVEDSSSLNMTRANAKALGLLDKDNSNLDGYIMMNNLSNSSLGWDYNPSWTGDNSLDFLSTAVHEIGHVLGFVSGIDRYQGVNFSDMDSFWSHFGSNDGVENFANNVMDLANPLDLFRYSDQSLNGGSSQTNTIDMSIGSKSFFGAGQKNFAFATGKDTSIDGDGFQASHWKQKNDDSKVQGIMDPLMKPGIIRRISNRDIIAMDAIGYDINENANNLIASTNAEMGWIPVTGQGTEIETLQENGKEHIAKSVYSDGEAWWVDWWANNDPESAIFLTSDRSEEINQMVDQSEIYEGRRGGRLSSSSSSYSQEIFTQQAYFSSISQECLNTHSESSFTLTFTFPSMSENWQTITQDSNIDGLASKTDSLEIDTENQASIREVAMDLLSSANDQDEISTVSTKLETEIVEQTSLYNDQLGESNFAIPLS